MSRPLRSVRVRVCLGVTALFAVALTAASVAFVNRVHTTLLARIEKSDLEALQDIQRQLENGSLPSVLPQDRPNAALQAVNREGKVVAGTPGFTEKPLVPPRAPLEKAQNPQPGSEGASTGDALLAQPQASTSVPGPTSTVAGVGAGAAAAASSSSTTVPVPANAQLPGGAPLPAKPPFKPPPGAPLPPRPPGNPGNNQPNQGQPNQGQPNQGQPNQGQPNQGQPNQGRPPARPAPRPENVVMPAGQLQGAPQQPRDWAVTRLPVETLDGDFELIAASPLDDLSQSVEALKRGLLIGIPLLVLLIGSSSWLVTGKALRPVAAMTDQVDEITASTLHERVPVPQTGDEIAHLAVTMNAMLDRIESANIRQKQFASDASHELRSPVSSIRTELEVALLHPEATDWSEVARNVLAEDERLERIVRDLLLLARLDEQPKLDRSTEVDLDAVVEADVRRARRIPVDTSQVGPARVLGDSGEIASMVGHLVDNACRHAVSAVAVTLAPAEDPHGPAEGPGSREHTVLLTVDDDGPGVPPDQRGAIFERFGRLEEGRSRDTGGAGLGLAVVSRIVERHGGQVSVLDSPLGGARFAVALPAAP